MELFKASNQWMTRPVDETFWGIDDALIAANELKAVSRTADVFYDDLRFESDGSEVVVLGQENVPAFPTYSAMNQMCQRTHVPHELVSRQPAELAVKNLNWGLREYRGGEDDLAVLLLTKANGRIALRAATSKIYNRFWNSEFLAYLKNTLGDDWRIPPAVPSPSRMNDPRIRRATEDDVLKTKGMLSVRVGDMIGPAGVYMSDKDLFLFLWNDSPIDGPSGPLHRFCLTWNNEIGTGSWGAMLGYADHVCGNHIIWGAQGVIEVKVRHVGEKATIEGMGRLRVELNEYSDKSASDDEALLKKASQFEIAAKKEDVIEAVFNFGRKKRDQNLTLKRITAAYDRAEQAERYGPPNTPWALSSGLTELSQELSYADERTALDKAAGKVLEMAF